MPPIFSIVRSTDQASSTIKDGAAIGTTTINMQAYSGGHVFIPNGWSAANLGFKASWDGSTWSVLKDEVGVPIQIGTIDTTTGAWYALPEKMFAAWYLIPWSKNTTSATETDVNQTGDKALRFVLKG